MSSQYSYLRFIPAQKSNGCTHLVTITPGEVLCPNVLVWVLGLLLKRWSMGNMLPMLGPEAVCIDAGDHEGGNDDAGALSLASWVWYRATEGFFEDVAEAGG